MPTLTHSQKLERLIRDEMDQNSGYLSFARFMELALYAPELGYYSAASEKFGGLGDFVTAPLISPLFTQCVAAQCLEVAAHLGAYDFLELGAGTGKFAGDILLTLEKAGLLPTHYFILEISADLRARQHTLLQQMCPHLLARVQWLEQLPTTPITGIIFANEVLDALPVHVFQYDELGLRERCVTVHNEKFVWDLMPASSELSRATEAILPLCSQPTISEINLSLPTWISALENSLKQGLILLIDYGYHRRDYYHPDRTEGTLMCHYRHQRHTDPLIHVGLQDITAHVDFTYVIESTTHLTLAGYTTQAAFLLNCGLLELANNTLSATATYQQSQAIKQLTLPGEMGEIVKVMGLSKDLDIPLRGFSFLDRRRDL